MNEVVRSFTATTVRCGPSASRPSCGFHLKKLYRYTHTHMKTNMLLSLPFLSLPLFHSLNCSSSEAQGVSGEFVRL